MRFMIYSGRIGSGPAGLLWCGAANSNINSNRWCGGDVDCDVLGLSHGASYTSRKNKMIYSLFLNRGN